jgi:hypothetical protein
VRRKIKAWVRRNVRVLTLGALIVTVAQIGLAQASDPRTRPMNHTVAVGAIVNDVLNVTLDEVVMCACWQGPNKQSEKKVKFKITNNGRGYLDLRGGADGSVYLYVAYPGEFRPVVRLPNPSLGTSQTVTLGWDGSPPNRSLVMTDGAESLIPDRVDTVVAEELGVESGWGVWAIPANPNRVTQEMVGGQATLPTYVTKEWLGPSESYLGEGNGIGAWVFYIPLPPEIEALASTRMVTDAMLTNGALDQHYRVMGVAIRDRDGTTVGFGPTPPESAWSSGGDF